MLNGDDDDSAARQAADVLVAYVQHNLVSAADLPDLARKLREAFSGTVTRGAGEAAKGVDIQSAAPIPSKSSEATLDRREETGKVARIVHSSPSLTVASTPAVPIADSVHDDYLISLEDGKHYRSLRRHLMAKYGMSPEDYRKKWGLPPDYPMVAPSYARDRSEVAKRSGLGHMPRGNPTTRPLSA